MFYLARKRIGSEAHLEGELILSILQLGSEIRTVDDIGDGVADVGPHGVVVVILLNDGNVGTHADDAGIDGLAVEVVDTGLIHVGLAGGDAAGDDAAVGERQVIGLSGAGAAAEGVGEELTGEVDVLAVAGDVEGGAAVGRIAFLAAFQGRDGGDGPLAAVVRDLLDGRNDPVAVHDAGDLVALDGLVGVLRPGVREDDGAVLGALNDDFDDLRKGLIVDEVRLAVFPLGEAFSLHHQIRQVIAGMVHGEQGIAGLLLDIAGNLKPTVPADAGDVGDGVAALRENVGAVGEDRGAVVNRSAVVDAADGAVAQLLSAEVIPVDVSAFESLPCVGIVGDEVLNVVILEKNDIGQGAQVAGRGSQGDGLFDITGTGLLDNFQLEVGVDIPVGGFSGLQSGDVEVGIPCVDGQGVVVFGEGNAAGQSQKRNAQRENQCEGEFLFS